MNGTRQKSFPVHLPHKIVEKLPVAERGPRVGRDSERGELWFL